MLQLQLHDFMLHHLPLWSCIPTFQTITQIGGTVATIETYWKAILKPAVVASILCLLAAGMGWGVDDILLLYATCVATAGSAFAWLLHFATRREWMLYLLHANVVSHELLAKTRWRSQTGLLRVVVCRDVPSVAIGINRTWLNSLTNEDTIYKGKITRHKSCSIANTKVGNLNSYYHSVFLNSIQNVINTLIIFCHLEESWPSNSKRCSRSLLVTLSDSVQFEPQWSKPLARRGFRSMAIAWNIHWKRCSFFGCLTQRHL